MAPWVETLAAKLDDLILLPRTHPRGRRGETAPESFPHVHHGTCASTHAKTHARMHVESPRHRHRKYVHICLVIEGTVSYTANFK